MPGRAQSDAAYPDPRRDREAFWRYLRQPYPVVSMTFARPGSEVSLRGEKLDGWLYYEGALEPGTHYVRHLSDMKGQSERYVGMGNVAGMTRDGVTWAVDGKAAQGKGGDVSLSLQQDTASRNRADRRASDALRDLRTVLSFGMGHIVYGSLEHSGDEFTLRFLDETWPNSTNEQPVKGRVESWVGNLPGSIRLFPPPTLAEGRTFLLSYAYEGKDPGHWFPTQIDAVIEGTLFRKTHVMTRKVFRVEFGTNASPLGYSPRSFLPDQPAIRPTVLIATNNDVYWVNGQVLEPLRRVERVGTSRAPVLLISALTCSVIVGALLARAYRRGRVGQSPRKAV